MNRKKDFFKNLIILSFGSILPKAAQLITLPIITNGLSLSEYGTYDLLISLISLLLPVATLQMQTAAFRFLLDCRGNRWKTESVISNILIFILPMESMIVCILFFCLQSFPLNIRIVICFYFYFEILLRTFQQIARGVAKNKLYSISAILESLIQLLLIVFLVLFWKQGLLGALISIAAANLIVSLVIAYRIKLWKYIHFSMFSLNALKTMIGYSWPMIPNSLSVWILSSSDRFVLTYFWGTEANAVYAAATKIPLILTTVQSAFALAWQENASIASKDKDADKYYSEMFCETYCFIIGLLALLIASTPLLFVVLIQGSYQESYTHIFILYMGAFFNCIMTFMGGMYIAHKKTLNVGMTTICGAMINLIVDLALISKMRIYAATVSTLVSFLFMAVYRMIDVKRFQKIHYPIQKMIISVGIVSIMCVISVQNDRIFNYINICIGIVFALCMNHSLVKKFWDKLRGT